MKLISLILLSGCATTERFQGFSEKGTSCAENDLGEKKCYVYRVDEDKARFHKLDDYQRILIEKDPDADDL